MLIHRPRLAQALYVMNYVVLVLFVVEMLLRLTAMGLWNYVSDLWCLLDCVVIIVSMSMMAACK